MIDHMAVEVAVDDVRALVTADGGDLLLTAIDDDTITLTLVLDSAECRECVMPGAFLGQVALDMMAPTVDGLRAVVIDDPRIAGEGSGA